MAVSNAPLATINISILKPSRFLMERGTAPHVRELPYRDHEGRINLHLCAKSEVDIERGPVVLHPNSVPEGFPQGVQDTLKAWTKHARAWALKEGPTWTREEGAQGGAAVWVSSAGERLREGGPVAKARPPRVGTESCSRVTSRVAPRCFITLHRNARPKVMPLPAEKTSFAAFKVAWMVTLG